MITIEVMGGLGNQLFQIFTLISTSFDAEIPFYFENKPKPVIGDRILFYWDSFLTTLREYKQSEQAELLYREHGFEYTPIPSMNFPKDRNIKLFGYFQSYLYFHKNKEMLFRLINLNQQKQIILHKHKEHYFDECVSLHFRIGDYVNIQEHHPLLKIEYYKKAINELLHTTNKNNWKILCFYEKNDENIVQGHINELRKSFPLLEFESVNHTLQDWEQMLSMSLCQHNIIANSSFSWWGAYMNNNNNIVYYPNVWFGPAQGTKVMKDMYPKNWTQISDY